MRRQVAKPAKAKEDKASRAEPGRALPGCLGSFSGHPWAQYSWCWSRCQIQGLPVWYSGTGAWPRVKLFWGPNSIDLARKMGTNGVPSPGATPLPLFSCSTSKRFFPRQASESWGGSGSALKKERLGSGAKEVVGDLGVSTWGPGLFLEDSPGTCSPFGSLSWSIISLPEVLDLPFGPSKAKRSHLFLAVIFSATEC